MTLFVKYIGMFGNFLIKLKIQSIYQVNIPNFENTILKYIWNKLWGFCKFYRALGSYNITSRGLVEVNYEGMLKLKIFIGKTSTVQSFPFGHLFETFKENLSTVDTYKKKKKLRQRMHPRVAPVGATPLPCFDQVFDPDF